MISLAVQPKFSREEIVTVEDVKPFLARIVFIRLDVATGEHCYTIQRLDNPDEYETRKEKCLRRV